MTMIRALTALLILSVACIQPAAAQARSSADSSFRAFLVRFEAATRDMLSGRSEAWLSMVSREPTLFTPFGGVRTGRDSVLAQYRYAASRLGPRPATLEVEYLHVAVSGDLAFTMALERSLYQRADVDTVRKGYTRATHIFRREDGEWKLAHRHMDHIVETAAPPKP
jgi:ketosteroid isomerase-like protein